MYLSLFMIALLLVFAFAINLHALVYLRLT